MKAYHQLFGARTFYGFMVLAIVTSQFGIAWQNARAANFYWDADSSTVGNNTDGTGLGGTGLWNISTANWWDGTARGLWPNTSSASAIFTAPASLLPTLSTVTLSSGIVTGQLSFLRGDYLLTGGNLTLAGTAPTLSARLWETVTIESQLLGTGGLTLLGGGTVRLTNAANSYTGTTAISSGILSITSSSALGTDSSAIVVTGSATRGFTGGALMLAGSYNSGVTLTRDVSLQGLGPIPAFGAALMSIGNNTISGALTNGSGALNTGISSAGGRLTLNNVTLAGTTGTTFLTVGVGSNLASVPGLGSYAITGVLSGAGSIQKSGGGTLVIAPSNATGYTGTFRLYSGSMRFESVAAFGSNTGAGILSTLDLAGDSAILELRMDSAAIGKNVYNRGGGSPIIAVDHAIGSSMINGTASFGTLTYDDGESLTFNGRNGFGVSFGTAPVITGDGNTTFTNNLNGTLTFTGDFWSDSNNTAPRTMTIGGNGNTLIDGNIIATAANSGHSLTKNGTGTLTITGTASTYTGNTSITGVLSVVNLGGINKNSTTGSIILGTTTTAGALQYTGAADTLAKPFNLAGTTGGGAILADGTGPLTITGAVSAGGAGIKNLFLGGSNTGDNTFSGLLLDNTSVNTTGLMKIGSGTWVLKEPSSVSLGSAGSVAIAAPGTTATTLITLSSGTTAGMVVGQTLALPSSLIVEITGILDSTHFTVSTAVTTTTAPAGTYAMSAIPTTSSTTLGGTWSGPLTLATGTLKLQATNAASNIVPNANAVVFNVDAYTANQAAGGTLEFIGVSGLSTTENLGALTPTAGMNTVRLTSGGAGAAANLVFSSLGTIGKGSGVNFSTTGGGGGTVTISGVLTTTATTLAGNGHFYIDGSNFARSLNGVLVAPVYGTDNGFVTSASGLTASSNNQITGSFTNAAVALTSLKISGSRTLSMSGTLTINTGGAANDGGILQTGGSSTITSDSATARSLTTGGAGAIVIRVDGASDVLTLSSTVALANTTTGGLTKNGQGTLILAGANAQTGITTINEGTVQLSGTGRLSGASQQLDLRQGATLDLNGVSTGTAINAFNGAGLVTNTSTTAATFNWGNTTTGAGVFSGIIQDGAGVVNVSKGGTTSAGTFSGLNTYTGVTTIGGSTGLMSVTTLANIGFASGIGRGNDASDITNAASLVFAGTTGGLNYTGLTSVSIDRLFTLNGSAAGSGAQIANASANNSTLIFNSSKAITFGTNATVAQTLTLGGASTGDNQIGLRIVDNGSLVTNVSKIGAGVWILGNATNNYTGTTTIGEGSLVAQDFSTLSNDSGLILGSGTTSGVFQSSGDFTRTLVASASAGANTVSWNSALTSGSAGFAASTGKLVVAIGGLTTPTDLVWNSGGFMGTTAATTGTLLLNSTTALGEVEFRNAIDLNGAVRTITVNDNTSTFTDFATITGNISGASGIIKAGAGLLQLLGSNSYTGTTAVTAGQLVVTSLGSTANPGASSLGASNNTASGALTLGNTTTTAGILQYIGAGETSDRMIRLNTTTGNTQILADGTGALILTNVVNDMVAGTKTLSLRGGNTQGNMITSSLANNVTALSITADQGATWILTGNNSYTGNTSILAGALGAGSDTAFGASTVILRNGSLFAYGADRTLANAISITTTSTGGTSSFIGDYSLNLTGNWSYTNTSTGHTITNGMGAGTTLTVGGNMVLNALTANVTFAINGSGNTVLNGDITTTTAFTVGINYTGDGTLTLGGVTQKPGTLTINNAAGTVVIGNANAFGGPMTLTAGTLRSNGTARTIAGNVTLSGNFTIGGNDKFTFNGTFLNSGGTRTLTVNTAGGVELAGQVNLSESATSARSFTINGTGDVLISGAITNGGGTGASTLTYSGSGTLTLTNGGNSYTGTTTLNNASGTLRLVGAGKLGTSALIVNAGTLSIESVNQSVTALTMGNVAGAASTINVASGLTLSVTAITSTGTTALPATITGNGTLALGSAGITVSVADNTAQSQDMIWTIQNLTGSGLFTKAGTGILDLSGITNNNFTGSYLITAGAITGLDALSNNLSLNGGVYQSSGTFTRGLGTGSNQVQFLSLGGGFAAVGGTLTVAFAGAPDPLVWGLTSSFVPDAAPLIFGSTMADAIVNFTHNIDLNSAVRTVTVTDNTAVTTDLAVLSGVLSNGSLNKAGAGTLQLNGANTFSSLTLTAGTLQFSTVSNNGGGPSNLGQGTDNITLAGGILSFVGDGVANSQSTNRAITVTASTTLNAAGTNGATITYAGAISAAALQVQLTGAATSAGFITGGIVQNTSSPDLLISSGNWTISGAPVVVGDDFKINGVGTVLNLNSTGVVTYVTGTSNFIYMGNGSTVNINADDVSSAALGLEGILVGFETTGAISTLNINNFTITTPRFDVGQIGAGLEGNVIGSGTIIVTVTTANAGLSLYRGSVSAKLAGVGALSKSGMGDVTLSGDNSGLTGVTRLDAGNLILDYTTSNTDKINAATALDMRGGTLTINGSNSAATSQTVSGLTLSNSGANKIYVNHGTGRDAVLNLGAITRANGAQDGTVRFVLPTGTQSATNGITTTTTNGTHGLLGLSGFATVTDSTGTWFATNATNLAGGNVIGLISTLKNDVTSWLNGDHITDATTGFTGTLTQANINSLRFNAAGGSALNIASGGVLNIASGGILVTSNVASGTPGIFGGNLVSGVAEIIITQDSAQTFEISSNIRYNHALTKTGAGTLLLSGMNTYADETEIQEGTLQVNGGTAIGDVSQVTLADDRYSMFQLLADETIGRLAGGSATAGLDDLATVDVGSHTLTFNQNAATTYAGVIIGSGALVKNGLLFDLTLSNVSSFSGVLRINGGGVILSGIGEIDASSIEINKGGYLRLTDSSTTRSGTRILDTTPITLNSADGGIAGNLLARGLYITTDQTATLDETVDVITLGSGASYATLEATVASADSDIIMTNLVRANDATLNVRGTNLGSTNAQNNQFRIGNTTNQTAFITALIGGGGAAGSQNISIVPWAIGETLAGAIAATNMGNSLLTYVSGAGLRPLDFTEYNTFTAAAVTDNVRESLTADLTGLSGKTINALVINDNGSSGDSTINVLGTGAGQTLVNTSGAFLFTLNPLATDSSLHSITLGGFNGGIQVGAVSGEYLFYVVNPSATTTTAALAVTISSALNSGADITKSGRGTLILNTNNSAGGGTFKTTLNEGVLEISDLDNIGGSTGSLVFAGGTLRLSAASYSGDDLSTRTFTLFSGGGILDTNGNNIAFANAIGAGSSGSFTKTGAGVLTLNAQVAYTGDTIISGGTLLYGIQNALPTTMNVTLAGGTVDIGSFTTSLNGLTLMANSTLVGNAALTLAGDVQVDGAASRTLTVNNAGLTTFSGDVFYLVNSGTTARTTTINGSGNVIINNEITNGLATGNLTYSGTGTLILTGTNSYSGTTSVSTGALGAGSDNAFGTSILSPRNGTLFASGGDRTIANAVTVASTTSGGTFTFIGNYNLNLTGAWNYTNTTAGHTITNNMASGTALTLDGDMVLNALTGSVGLTFNGSGKTVFNGDISTSTAFNVNVSYTGSGTLVLTGINPTAGTTTLNNVNGTLQLVGAGKLGSGALTVNAGTLSIESVNQSVTTLTMGNVAGTTATINVAAGLTLSATAITFSGTTTLPATITGDGTLDLGTAGITVSVADNTSQPVDMIWTIKNLIGGGLFTKTGAGTLDISGIANNNFNGTYLISAGAIIGLDSLSTNLILNGGVYQGSGTFTRSLGTGNNQVQFQSLGGGFAAAGGNLTVTFAGAPDPLVWGVTPSFVPDGAPLIFGSITADSVTDFTHNIDLNNAVRTVSVVDNTAVTTDLAVLSGVLSNGSLTKAGTGVLQLNGNNTFTGAITVSAGTLQFSTVSNANGAASNLGQGSAVSIGAATLSFIGSVNQSTDRAITLTAAGTLAANGTGAATITYTGAISTAGNSLTLTGTGEGFITGGVTQTSNAADINVNSGIWHLSTTASALADDVIVTATSTGSAVLNLDTTGILTYTSGNTSNGLYARDGGVINLNANDVNGVANSGGLDFIFLGDTPSGNGAILNTNTFNITIPRLDLGGLVSGRNGVILGSGTVIGNYTGTDYAQGFRLFAGVIRANLAGVATILKQGLGTVTISGNNSGLTGTVAATRIDSGTLILDFTLDNNNKISSVAALDMRGGVLSISGSDAADTSQSVASTTLGNGGTSSIILSSGSGHSATLNLGVITRANSSQDGTLRVVLPASGAVTTTSANSGTTGVLGGWATVTDATGTWFATNSAGTGLGNIVAITTSIKNDVSTWLTGDQITNSSTGFTGTIDGANINTLRFNAASGGTLNISGSGVLNIASGGILMTSNVSSAPVTISGGVLSSSTSELIFTQDRANQTLTVGSSIRINHSVTKAGIGAFVLTGNNTYTGTTEIQSGILQVSGGRAIGDTSLVNLADDASSMLQLLSDETIGRLSGGNASTGIDQLAVVDVGSHTLTINETASTTYAGLVTGNGTLIKTGTGNLQFTNVSSGFTGNVTVNMGLLYFTTLGSINASSFTLNSGGSLLIDENGTTTVGTRILDSATIALNSANGSWSGETKVSGLSIRRDQASTLNETVGVITAMSGASYARLEATVASAITAIIADDIVRQNGATLDVRGTNMSATTTTRAQLRIGTTANQTNFIASMIGGGSTTLGTKNISIVNWAIAEDVLDAGIADTNMGNSLATYVTGQGFRALNLSTEYNTYSAAGTKDNVRESLAANLTGLAGKTINALVIDNSATLNAVSFSGAGAGQTLINTSGTFLFTLNTTAAAGTAYNITLDGFGGGITVGSTNEYVIFVQNPSSLANAATLTATINSVLGSTADITKSGRGTLVLTAVNTAGGGTRKTTLNEGTLEIADLDNIGGSTGALVFAGGTLRLSSTYAGDDISTRTITFFNGGGTLDTNGFNLTLANSVGSGTGGLTKTGLGNLTLSAAATYTGTTTVAGGTLTVGANNATGAGGDISIGAGATLDIGTYSITAGLFTTTGAGPSLLGSGTITASNGFSFGNTGDISVAAVLAGGGGLLKTQTNILTLTGLSTFTGPVEVQAGTLSFNSIANISGGASALGSVTNALDGVIHLGLTTAATTLSYTGSGSSSDRTIGLQGTTGAITLDASGTGALVLGGVHMETAGNKTLTLRGSSDAALANIFGAINEYSLGVLTLLKTDANTWVLNTSNTYTGATSIDNGILRLSAAQTMTGALNFGSTTSITTAGTLDVGADSSFASLTAQTNSATNTNHLQIAAGKTLAINGNVVIGTGVGALSTTLLDSAGGGSLVVVNAASSATFRVGGSAANGNVTLADLSGLDSLSVSLNTTNGVFRVGSTSTTAVNSTYSRLVLADNTTITAATLAVGDGGQYNGSAGQVNQLLLGTGTTSLNIDTLNIGTSSATTGRDLGSITFFDTNGTLTIRAANGTGAAAFNMGTGTSTATTVLPTGNRNTFDVSGHTVDLLFGAVNIGTQAARTGPLDNLFAFDKGTLTMGNLTMGSKTAAGNSTNVMNLGGGTVVMGSGTGTAATLASNTSTGVVSSTINVTGGTVTIGSGSGQALILGNSNTSATGSTNTALNVSAGNVTLATTGATAVTMANAAAGAASAAISITGGGTLTVQGAIVRGTGGGTRNATITLDGGTLDMTGKAIGASGNAITFNAQSGTLQNLAELNGGGSFTKTTSATLFMGGTNSYTGTTTISAGTLQFLKESALYNSNSTKWTDANIIVSAGATAAFNVGGAGEFSSADVSVLKTLGSATGGFQSGSFLGLDTSNVSGGTFTYAGVIADTNGGANSLGLKKMGTNTLALTQTNTYTGSTTVSAGTLQVGDGISGNLAGAGNVTVNTGATLSGSGSIAGSTVINSGAVLAPGVGLTAGSNQTLTFTAAGTAVEIKDGGQIQLGLSSSSQVDAGFNVEANNALTYLNNHGGATGTTYTTVWAQSGNYDSIKLINGTFTLGHTADGTVKLLDNGATLTLGSIFKLLDWSTVGVLDSLAGTGNFTLADLNLSGVALDSGLGWDTSAFTTYGVIVVVPEPSRMLLLMLGGCGCLLRRRRHR